MVKSQQILFTTDLRLKPQKGFSLPEMQNAFPDTLNQRFSVRFV